MYIHKFYMIKHFNYFYTGLLLFQTNLPAKWTAPEVPFIFNLK